MTLNTQGHGVEGRFGGLDDEYSAFDRSKIVILPVAFDLTSTYQKGSDKGPAAIIEASRNLELYDIETDSQVCLEGICTMPTIKYATSNEMRENLYFTVNQCIRDKKFVVTLGGEHSISWAPIKAHSEHYPSLSVLQLDAHLDLQENYENNPWSHASVMARVSELPKIDRIVAVGIRSMSHAEKVNLARVVPFFCHELFESDGWMDQVVAQLSDDVYLTFDLDVFDSSLMPSTGTPEPGGLYWPQVMKLLKKVINQRNLVGFDVVELCPKPGLHAPDFLAAKLVYKILSYRFESQGKE